MRRLTPSLITLLLTAWPAFAQFEGELEMKMTMTDKDGASMGGGTTKVAVSRAGTRSEMNMQMQQMNMKMVMLLKNDAPDIMYRLNEANQTYTEMNLAKLREMAAKREDTDKWTVEKLGEENMMGYRTQHVLVKHKGMTMEMWTAKDFLDLETYRRLQARQGQMGDGMMKALKEAGADGMPLKSLVTNDDGSKVTSEVVRADKKSMPASTFEIPAGYTKSAGGMMDMMGGMSGSGTDEAKKRMEEMMKNMTPEQRQRMEQMMKQRGATQP